MTRNLSFSDRALAAGLAIALLATGVSFLVAPPQKAEAYTWGTYKVVYKYANSFDCAMQREVAERFTGPIQKYDVSGCQWRIRSRRTSYWVDAYGWKHRLLYLENSAPVWNAWGMSMTVEYKYKNGVLKIVGEPTCRAWAFFVTVKKEVCSFPINTDGVDTATAKMQYTVGWSYLFGNVSVDRGAKVTVGADGFFGAPVYWP